MSRVLRAGLTDFGEGLTRVEDAIETAGAHEHTILRRNLSLLSSVANIATMLGLLGTVLGMIESFDLIAKTGTGDARVVAGGIFQALVTTAAGLMVGIFTIAFYSYFRRKVEILVIDLEDISFRLMQALSKETEAEPSMSQQTELAPAEA
jgi:biopolymer transport protein ExbB